MDEELLQVRKIDFDLKGMRPIIARRRYNDFQKSVYDKRLCNIPTADLQYSVFVVAEIR